MTGRRPAILIGILFVLLLGYLATDPRVTYYFWHPMAEAPSLPGKNGIYRLDVAQDKSGVWMASFDYFYNGTPPRGVGLRLDLSPQPASLSKDRFPNQFSTFMQLPTPGLHHVSVPIRWPGFEGTTQRVLVTLIGPYPVAPIFARQEIEKTIDWPSYQTWMQNEAFARESPEQHFQQSVELIDSERQGALDEARRILERLITRDAKFDRAYVELARVAIKTNWSPEGLHQAENLLSSALQIRPDSADAKILLGYVYAHQQRFAEATKLFTEVANSPTTNLWLWANWGDLLVMQGKPDQAILKYREAITRPMAHDSHDRGRAWSYRKLAKLLEERKDVDGMEALYEQQIAEFGGGSCYSKDYARFKLQVRGDAQGAIDLARGALNKDCDDAPSREILGLAQYVKWAETKGPERSESLNEARIYLPTGPMPLYLLATSERTLPAAKQLLASGEQIDQLDSEKMTALALALNAEDLAAARRLLMLGARPQTPVGYNDMPVALLPVLAGNIPGIRLMQQFGVDYSKLRYRGATALDYAKQSGNNALLGILNSKGTQL
jgi:tetratricopeptide (TPR) repeat protein